MENFFNNDHTKQYVKIILLLVLIFVLSLTSNAFAQDTEYKGTEKKLLDVAKDIDPNGEGFDIDYILEGELTNNVIVNSQSKSVTFEYDSKGIKEDVLIIILPRALIDEPIGVYVDGIQETSAIRSMQENDTRLIIPVFKDSKEIQIVGTKVVPEFATIAPLFVISIISVIFLTKLQFSNRF